MNEADLIGLVGGLFGCGIVLGFLALFIFVWWKLISKTGHHGVLALLFLVPVANLALLVFLAFSEWPLERRVRELEATRPPHAP